MLRLFQIREAGTRNTEHAPRHFQPDSEQAVFCMALRNSPSARQRWRDRPRDFPIVLEEAAHFTLMVVPKLPGEATGEIGGFVSPTAENRADELFRKKLWLIVPTDPARLISGFWRSSDRRPPDG